MKNRGFALIELVIASAIILIGLLSILPLLESMSLSNKHLARKLDQIDDKSTVMISMMNPQVCSCHLNPGLNVPTDDDSQLTFDPAAPGILVLTKLRGGCVAGSGDIVTPTVASEAGLVPRSIQVKNLVYSGTGKEWTGTLAINYDTPQGDVGFQPTEISLRFNINDTFPGKAFIDCCNSPSPFTCNPTIPTVPHIGGGSDPVAQYFKLIGMAYPIENSINGCTSPQVFAELWEAYTPYVSAVDTGQNCRNTGAPPATPWLCYSPVVPEKKLWSGCY